MTFKTQQLFFFKSLNILLKKIKGPQIWSLWIKNACKQSFTDTQTCLEQNDITKVTANQNNQPTSKIKGKMVQVLSDFLLCSV